MSLQTRNAKMLFSREFVGKKQTKTTHQTRAIQLDDWEIDIQVRLTHIVLFYFDIRAGKYAKSWWCCNWNYDFYWYIPCQISHDWYLLEFMNN